MTLRYDIITTDGSGRPMTIRYDTITTDVMTDQTMTLKYDIITTDVVVDHTMILMYCKYPLIRALPILNESPYCFGIRAGPYK